MGDVGRLIKSAISKQKTGVSSKDNSEEEIKRSNLLRQTNNKINPILTSFANELLGVLSSWFEDPKVLCCLVQAIFTAYLSQNNLSHTKFYKFVKNNYKLSETGFADFLDSLITLIDFIIILLTDDLKRFIFIIPDIIKIIYDAIMGAIILLIQETAFALRDSVIKMILQWIDEIDTDQTWSKCLPVKQLLNVIKKYVNDYGILAKILEVTSGWIHGKTKNWSIGKNLVPKARDLEFLYWFRDLLVKLKRATLNFDVCVDYEFVPKPDSTAEAVSGNNRYVSDVMSAERNNVGDLNQQGGYTIASDGSVIVDRDKVVNGDWIPRISNDFIREFAHKEYGLPYEVIDNTLTRGTSADSIQGTLVNSAVPGTFSKCVDAPSAEDTLKWILNLRSRLE
jgi:hypothetical protein